MERRGSYVLINETGLASDRNCYNLVEFLLSFGQAAELPLRGPYERSKNAGLGEFSSLVHWLLSVEPRHPYLGRLTTGAVLNWAPIPFLVEGPYPLRACTSFFFCSGISWSCKESGISLGLYPTFLLLYPWNLPFSLFLNSVNYNEVQLKERTKDCYPGPSSLSTLEQIESMGGSFLYRILYPISWKVKAFGREGHYALWARRYFTGRPWRSNEYKSVPWVGLIWTSDTRANIVIFRTFSFRWRSSLIRWL